MPTFGNLRKEVIERSGAKDMFAFRRKSPAHDEFWDRMNQVEFARGYKPGEYEKPGSPPLCDMNLLTQEEYTQWLSDFDAIRRQ